jgi:hypothetical protein
MRFIYSFLINKSLGRENSIEKQLEDVRADLQRTREILDAILPGYFRLNETVLRLDEEVRTLRGEMPEVQARSHENNRLVHISLDRTNLLYDNYEALQKRVDGVSEDDDEEAWAAAPLADAPTVADPLADAPTVADPLDVAPNAMAEDLVAVRPMNTGLAETVKANEVHKHDEPLAEALLGEAMARRPVADDEKANEVDEHDEPLAVASLAEAPLADASSAEAPLADASLAEAPLAEVVKSPVAEGLVEAPLAEVVVKSPVAEGSRRNVADAPVAGPTLAEDRVNKEKQGDAKNESKDILPKDPQGEEETFPVDTPQPQPSSEMPPPPPPSDMSARIPSSIPTVTLIPATPQTSQEEVLRTLLQVPESSTVPSSEEQARRSRS